jgi:hypothetical protein
MSEPETPSTEERVAVVRAQVQLMQAQLHDLVVHLDRVESQAAELSNGLSSLRNYLDTP